MKIQNRYSSENQTMQLCHEVRFKGQGEVNVKVKVLNVKTYFSDYFNCCCNNLGTVLDFARSVLKLVVLDSRTTYCI